MENAEMTIESINEVYEYYRSVQKKSMEIESELLKVDNEEEWVKTLSEKSTFLRTSFIDVEDMLENTIYPFVKMEKTVSKEIADQFCLQAFSMSDSFENDGLFVTEVMKTLAEYYKGTDFSNEILSNFYTGLSYADRVNEKSNEKSQYYLKKVLQFKDKFSEIKSQKAKGNMVIAFFNRLANFYIISEEDWFEVISIYEDMKAFCGWEEVQESLREKIDINELIEAGEDAIKYCMTSSELAPPNEVLEYVYKNLFLSEITEENFLEQSCYDALTYIWYNFHKNIFDSGTALLHAFSYYMEKDKNIDYSNPKFYEEENYQVQMIFIKECFKYLSMVDSEMLQTGSIRDRLIDDFTRLYQSIPYQDNNSLLNMDMLEIMHQLLCSSKDEEEAFEFIKGVAIQRNAMTLIHSTMVAQISNIILNVLLDNAPELFFEVLGVNTVEEVEQNRKYLIDYMEKAAYIHDIGKIVISDVINMQTRKITNDEFSLIKFHSEFGNNLIKNTIFEEKYAPLILGHHKFSDGSGGYPENFDNTKVKQKILIDILTISDCIDAATDILGRNYTSGKSWIPTVRDEIVSDDGHRYNKTIVDIIKKSREAGNSIQYLTSLGRVKIYYNIYQTYLAEDSIKLKAQ